jgi:hypothetical protein
VSTHAPNDPGRDGIELRVPSTPAGQTRPLASGTSPWETAAGFLSERQDFLHVFVVKSPGSGWDVVVRIDGSYSGRGMAEGAAECMRDWITSLIDVEKDRRYWWDGPPWLQKGDL